MEFIVEVIFGTILEGSVELWTNFMKKRNPNYNNSISKKVFTVVISVLLVVLTTIFLVGILFLIEWKFPNLIDVVSFD